MPRIPELLLGWGEQRFVRSSFRANARPEAFTDDDIERYRVALARPGALTAALNYYRAMRRPTNWSRAAWPRIDVADARDLG